MKGLIVLALFAFNAFGQTVIANLQFSDQERNYQIEGPDTVLIAEFNYENNRIKSPAREQVIMPDRQTIQSSIENLQMLVALVAGKGWAKDTTLSHYRYVIETEPGAFHWRLDMAGAETRVRFNQSNGRTTIQ